MIVKVLVKVVIVQVVWLCQWELSLEARCGAAKSNDSAIFAIKRNLHSRHEGASTVAELRCKKSLLL